MSLVPEYDSESEEENADDTGGDDDDNYWTDNGKQKIPTVETFTNSNTSTTTINIHEMPKIPLKMNDNSSGKMTLLLPSAIQLLNGIGISNSNTNNINNNNVFSNPYKDAENAKIANLEMHVKMVETEGHTNTKNCKKMCLNYSKGRCRYGNKCIYAHDSDLHDKTFNDSINIDLGIMGGNNNNRNNVTSTVTNKMYNKKYGDNGTNKTIINNNNNNTNQIDGYRQSIDKDQKIIKDTEEKNANSNSNIKRKYRPGLGNSIIPSKKVIKHYNDLTITKIIP